MLNIAKEMPFEFDESLIAAADVQSSDEQSFDGHMILFD